MNSRTLTLLGLWVVGILAVAGGFRLRAAAAHARLDLQTQQKAHDRSRGQILRLENKNRLVAEHLADLRNKPQPEALPTTRTAPEALARLLGEKAKYRALIDDPRMIQLTRARTSANLRQHYGELYRQLRLPPDRAAALEALLLEGRERQDDIRVTADFFKEAIPAAALRSLLDEEKRLLEIEQRALLGPEAFQKLQAFEETAPGRALVDDVSEALIFSAAPLGAEQRAMLLELVQTYRTNEPGDDGAAPAFDWRELELKAATFLTVPQRAELASSVAALSFRDEQRSYGALLKDWIRRNLPSDR